MRGYLFARDFKPGPLISERCSEISGPGLKCSKCNFAEQKRSVASDGVLRLAQLWGSHPG